MTTEKTLTLADLCEVIPDWKRAWLDRKGTILNTLRPAETLDIWILWARNGYIVLRNFIPPALLYAYSARYEADNGKNSRFGYKTGTPYSEVREIKDLCLYAPLVEILDGLIGESMGMNLNLTNWVSTERSFHQDDYLNPPEVNGHYLAAWIALDDIHPDAGRFEFVPGSHKWPVMRMEKVLAQLEPHQRTDPGWPRFAEKITDPLYDAEIERRGAKIESVDLKKGDVIIWHAWLVHRGGRPKNPDLLRKSLICHYSGIHHRPDMQPAVLYENPLTNSKGYYFPF